jgi:hypothetical protein
MDVTEAVGGPIVDNAGKVNKGLDDVISAALDAREPKEAPAPKVSAPKASKSPARADPVEDVSAGDDTSGEDAAQIETESPTTADEGVKVLIAPKHWPEADKQAFAKLTRDGQEIALKLAKNLEGGFTRKSQELSDQAKFATSVRGLFDDTTRSQLQTAGMDEVGYVRYLHSLQQEATRNPVRYLKWAMQNLGVTPDQLGFSQAGTEKQAAEKDPLADLLVDPKIAELEAKQKQLEDYIERETQAKVRAEHATRQNSVNSINTTIKAFRETLNDDGQLQYPHFDTVRGHMGALMDTDPDLAKLPDGPDKLKAAYDMAVWARPDLRQSFLEAETQKQVLEAQKKSEAERAKRITSVKPSAGVVSSRTKATSLDDAINQATSKLGF